MVSAAAAKPDSINQRLASPSALILRPPAKSSGNTTFSATVSVGKRLKTGIQTRCGCASRVKLGRPSLGWCASMVMLPDEGRSWRRKGVTVRIFHSPTAP
jgi:hypothetical protein